MLKQDLKWNRGLRNKSKMVAWTRLQVIAVEMDNFEWMNLK